MRGLVPKKPKHRRLRGDWSLKNLNNMAESSEKVSFRVDMQCSSLRAEAFLVFDRDSTLHAGLLSPRNQPPKSSAIFFKMAANLKGCLITKFMA